MAASLVVKSVLAVFHASETVFCAASASVSAAAFVFAAGFYAKKRGGILYLRKFSPVYVLPSVLLAAGMFLGLGFLNGLIADGVESIGGNVSKTIIPLDTPFRYVLFTVVLCVLPAIAEELFFRGVLAECLSKTGQTAGVMTVALCFALYHGNLTQFLYQFVYGLGLGFLTLKARSLIPAVIAHFINNFAVLTVEYSGAFIDLYNPIIVAAGAICIAGFIAFTFFYGKKSDVNPADCGKTESVKDFYIPFGIFGIVAFALAAVWSALPAVA